MIDGLDPGIGVGRPPVCEGVLEHPLGLGLATTATGPSMPTGPGSRPGRRPVVTGVSCPT